MKPSWSKPLVALAVLAGCNESPTARTHEPSLAMGTRPGPVAADAGFDIGGSSVSTGRGRVTVAGKST